MNHRKLKSVHKAGPVLEMIRELHVKVGVGVDAGSQSAYFCWLLTRV